jgi:hypothetical protein
MGATQEYVEDLLEQQRKARLEAANVQQYDHDKSARIFGVTAVTKLPEEVVAADLEGLEKKLAASEFNYEDYTDQINGAPAFNRFVAENPYHLSVLQRDHKNLSSMERAYRRMSLGWQSGWAMTEIAEIRDRQLTNFENPDREADKARLNQLSQLVEGGMFGADAWYSKVLVGTAQQVPIQAWLLGESWDEALIGAGTGAAIGAGIGVGAGGVGALPGAIVGAKVGLGRGFLVGRTEAAFRLERGLAYDQYLGMGLNEEEARWAASAVGGVNAALESIGLGALTKRIPGFRNIQNDAVGAMINSVLRKPTMRQAIGRATLMYGEGVATELVTEVLQEATLIVAGEMLKANERERGNLDPAMASMESDEFWDQIGDIAAHTLYGVALIGGIGPTANFMRDGNRAWKAEKYGAALDVMGDAAEKSETRKSAPTKYEEFVKKLAGDGNKIIIEARRFIDYFQEQGMDADEVAKSVGVTNLGDAEVSGLDIEIPADQYLAKIAPSPHHKGLKADLKESSDGMSENEAQLYRQNAVKTLKEIQELAASADPEQAAIDSKMVEQIKEKLIEAGTSPEAADFQAQIMVGLPNLARRAGRDPEQFARERFGGIVSTTNAQMRADKEDVDLFVDPFLDRIRAGDMPAQRDIFGPSIVDRIKASGGLASDSELEARDMKLNFRGLIKDGGRTLDDIAETLHEEGYIAVRDPNMVLDALDREAGGDLVFGNQFNIDTGQQELLGQLEQLSQILDQNGIDIADMTNAEVRTALANLDTFYQTDETIEDDEYAKLAKAAFAAAEHDPAMLARLELMIPRIAPIQEFGDITFTDDVTIDGKPGTRTRAANREFEMAKKRKNLLEKLRECLGG